MIKKTYAFNKQIDRRNTASVKWDEVDRLFQGKDLLPLWVADMDFAVPDAVVTALKKRAEHGVFGYSVRQDAYLSAVQDWMRNRHGWAIEKDWLCHSPGVVTALNLIVDAFTEPGDKVLIQPPVYPPFRKSAKNQHRELITNPLIEEDGRYQMDYEDLEEKMADPAVRLMILCSPHNPVGRVWTREELLKTAKLAMKYDVLIVSDEIHGDLVYPGHQHIPFASLSEEIAARTIVCTAPSKTFNIAGLQISNIVIANPDLRRKYQNQLNRYALGEANVMGLVAAEAAYREGEDWLAQCLNYIKGNADFVADFLEKHRMDLKLTPLEGTYLGWIDFRRLGLTKRELQDLMLNQAKVALNPGYSFGQEGEGFFRINLACPRSLIQKAMRQMEQAMTNLKR